MSVPQRGPATDRALVVAAVVCWLCSWLCAACTRGTEGYCDNSTPCASGQRCNLRTRLCVAGDAGPSGEGDVLGGPFTLLSSTPAKGPSQPLRADIELVFSRPVNVASASAAITLQINEIASEPAISVAGATVRVAPKGGLARGASYKLDVSTALRDVENHALETPINLVFGVADASWSALAVLTNDALCAEVAVAASDALGAVVVWREVSGIVRARQSGSGGWLPQALLGSPATSAPRVAAGGDKAVVLWSDGATVRGASLSSASSSWTAMSRSLGSGSGSVDPAVNLAVGADGVATIALVRAFGSSVQAGVTRGLADAPIETLDTAHALAPVALSADASGNVAVLWGRRDAGASADSVAAATYSVTDSTWKWHGAAISAPTERLTDVHLAADNGASAGSYAAAWTEAGAAPQRVFAARLHHGKGWVDLDQSNRASGPSVAVAASLGKALVLWRDQDPKDNMLHQLDFDGSRWTGSEMTPTFVDTLAPLLVSDGAGIYYGMWYTRSSGSVDVFAREHMEWLNQMPLGVHAQRPQMWIAMSPGGVAVAVVGTDLGGDKCQLRASRRR